MLPFDLQRHKCAVSRWGPGCFSSAPPPTRLPRRPAPSLQTPAGKRLDTPPPSSTHSLWEKTWLAWRSQPTGGRLAMDACQSAMFMYAADQWRRSPGGVAFFWRKEAKQSFILLTGRLFGEAAAAAALGKYTCRLEKRVLNRQSRSMYLTPAICTKIYRQLVFFI